MKKIILTGLFGLALLGITGCFSETNNRVDLKNTYVVAEENMVGGEYYIKGISETSVKAYGNNMIIVKNEEVAVVNPNGIKKGDILFEVNTASPKITKRIITGNLTENTKRVISGSAITGPVKLLGDFDFTEKIDITDFMIFVQFYGSKEAKFDIGNATKGIGAWEGIYNSCIPDGKVDIYDFMVFANNYGKTKPMFLINTFENNVLEDGLTAKYGIAGADTLTVSNKGFNKGKYYAEGTFKTAYKPDTYDTIGLITQGMVEFTAPIEYGTAYGLSRSIVGTLKNGDIVGLAVDLDNKKISFYVNGILKEEQLIKIPDYLYIAVSVTSPDTISNTWTLNFGRSPFKYAVPEGFGPFDK